MQVLGRGEGFPTLPLTTLILLRSESLEGPAIEEMEQAIRAGLPPPRPVQQSRDGSSSRPRAR